MEPKTAAMEGAMEVNRLEKEELTYELAIRGVTDKATVGEMRSCLRQFLKLEKHESNIAQLSYPYTFAADMEYLGTKDTEIEGLVESFKDDERSAQFRKTSTKRLHAFHRASRSKADTPDEHTQRSKFLVKFLELRSRLKSKARQYKRLSQTGNTPVDASVLMSSTTIGEEIEDDSESDIEGAGISNNQVEKNVKSVPVVKWNITKFSGDGRVSLSSFLETVEELCMARNVSSVQLLASASDLFTGQALIWFRAVRDSIDSWSELVAELRQQFQPSNYNDRLFQEIRQRTQGLDEPIGIYIAVMQNMFRRLTVPVSEEVKLKILLQNISPFYQGRLSLTDVMTVDDLLSVGRRIESRKLMMDSYVPPPKNKGQLMEPDLACIYSSSSSISGSSRLDEIGEVVSSNRVPNNEVRKCWNCGGTDHLANRCIRALKRHCFGCGRPGVVRSECSNCRNHSGNGSSRRQ